MPPTVKKRLSKKQREARKKRKVAEATAPPQAPTGNAFPLLGSKKKRKLSDAQPVKGIPPAKINKLGKFPNANGNIKTKQQLKGKLPTFSAKIPTMESESGSESEEEEEEGTWDTRRPSKTEKIDLEFEGVVQDEEADESESDSDDDEEVDEESDDDEDDDEDDEGKLDAALTKLQSPVPKAPATQLTGKPKPQLPPAKNLVSAPQPPSNSEDEEGDESEAEADVGAASAPVTLYVNQLPFEATKEQIVGHFASCNVLECRMCLDKTTKTFRGTAFVVVQNGAKALALHLSKLGSRVINVRPQLSPPELAAVAEKGQAIKRSIAKQQGQSHKGKKASVRKAAK